MMKHSMKLNLSPFQKVKEGKKKIEIRLNDEKRQLLQVGDEIEFRMVTDENQKIRTRVLELLSFPTFKELFAAFESEEYGGTSKDEYYLMHKIYSPEKEAEYGALAIRFQLLK
jgi:ASC-1-like (ASCH) protein